MNRLRVTSVCGEGGSVAGFPFVEDFSEGLGKWVLSRHDKYANQPISIRPLNITKYSGDKVLYLEQAMKHYGLAAPFTQPVDNHGKELVVQYEVKFDEPLQCGGAYIKLFIHDPDRKPDDFDNDTPYVIMFGPDRCGGTNKVHFILRHQNPVTGEWEEKHGQDAPTVKVDRISHLYTLVVRPDNSYEIFVDQTSAKKGSLLTDMKPPVNPPKMIDDPEDRKPEDWVDTPKVPDPDARKPDDWDEDEPREIPDMDTAKPEGWLDDEAEYVRDPEAEKPSDWDEEEDGEWEAPMVPNPKCEDAPGCGEWVRPMKPNPDYKGKWSAPLIDNPAYKGVWKPRQIGCLGLPCIPRFMPENPYFFTDEHPHNLPKIGALAVEIWTTNKGIQFDNFLVAYSEVEAFEYATSTWKKKYDAEKAADVSVQKESRSKEIAKKKAEGGWRNLLEAYALEAVDFAQDQPKAVTGTLVALLVTMIFLTLRGGRKTRQAPEGSETEGTEKAVKEVDEPPATEPSADKDEDEQEEDDKDK